MTLSPRSAVSWRRLANAVYRGIPLKRQLFAPLRGRLPERLYRHLHFHGPFTVAIDGRRSFRMMSRGHILENEMFWRPFGRGMDGVSLQAWMRLAAVAEAAILDVGANTGLYSLVARAANARARILAFEPVTRVAATFRENLALNGFAVELVDKAVSDRNARLPIFDSDADMEYDASLERHHGSHNVSYEIEAIRLDDFLDVPVSMMKLDIEEHEPSAIAGALTMLRRDRPAILVETIFDEPTRLLNEQLLGLGYRVFNIDEERGLIPADRLRMIRPGSWNNLLCTAEAFDRAGLGDLVVAAPNPAQRLASPERLPQAELVR